MATTRGRIGIDIGALFLKAARIDEEGSLLSSYYQPHRGDPSKILEQALSKLDVIADDSIGITGSAAGLFADTLGVKLLDMTRCQITGIKKQQPQARNIIDIGGGSVTLVQLDKQGNFQGYSTNSLCAAGTGSFLDEQAGRLGVSYADMKDFGFVEEPPSVATRCAVFAKSDLIHRQQEGYSKAEMWSGLCRGMTKTLLGTLLNGKPLDAATAVIGGVAQNRQVLRWLNEACPDLLSVPCDPHLTAAIGAAWLAENPAHPVPRPIPVQHVHSEERGTHEWPLSLEKSDYPSFEASEFYEDDDENEVRILAWPAGKIVKGWLGIDIGSTSTKLVLIDDQDRVILDIYRKTGGDPLTATKLLFRAMLSLAENKGIEYEILGVGTTGSGRKMVGKVIGADAIINEISAHVAGAAKVDPSIDTIFEIGGQDSKYMHVVNGHIRDANMNYVCAAGTGSFVEEQAKKLGYPVSKIGPAVLNIQPPRTSDRCTVFMEQDVAKLVQSGISPEEALAGVMVSVVKNYLNKVVGNRYHSREKIFFQGATARNQGLVAAFERLMGCKMVVSPYCHVMGSYGVAILTRAAMAEQSTTTSAFLGLDLDKRSITIRKDTCELCQNKCSISFASIEGLSEAPSWGYMCGRDPEEEKVRVNPHDKPLRIRQKLWRESGAGLKVAENAPVIGIPQALTTYTYLPLWRRFFNRLGFQIQLSGVTTDKIRSLASSLTGAEFCFPAKIAIGHAAQLATKDGVDYIFLPHMISEVQNTHSTATKFCPYVQSIPSYSRTALELNGIDTSRILSPVIDMRLSESKLADLVAKSIAATLGKTKKEIRAAWQDAIGTQRDFEANCKTAGRKILDEAAATGEKLLVLVGRPYNSFDTGINLGLPQKLAEQGRTVIPLDFLGANSALLGKRYFNTYWNYGQKILAGVRQIAKDDNLDAVYLTNFNCGPDSFLLTFAEQCLGNQPFLALELDEHGADAGYMTRIEAFCDVLNRPRLEPVTETPFRPEPTNVKDRTIWLPPMHPVGPELMAYAFRHHGFKCAALPPEDKESFELGRSLTRGSECLPTALTLGTFVKTVRSRPKDEKHAFFMPTAEGPCRFGQYCTLHRQVLDRAGLADVAILSPSSFNSYQGLDEAVRRTIWKAFVASDALLKATCKVRPYEVHHGETNRVLHEQLATVGSVIEKGGDLYSAIGKSMDRFARIETSGPPKPLVGVVGEIYVRCNSFANEDVIGAIERFGGEAWLAPMSEWILYTVVTQSISFYDRSHNFLKKWVSDLKNIYIYHVEHKIRAATDSLLANRHEPDIHQVIEEGEKYLPINFEGEALITVGRAVKFAHQGAAMVVNCAPFGCMPGTLTTALFRKIAPELGIPIVGMFYDGHGDQNQRLEVFLNNAVRKRHASTARPTDDRRIQPTGSPRANA
jgi:predicted CoA-substrate-specific enzyme activase